MKGIEFLRQGISLNLREPRLLGRMGWFIGQKIGRADEKKQYRRLFKADDDFHERDRPGRTLVERDNWLVGREKYLAAQKLVDSGAPLKTTPLIFHSEPMMTAINYARALESDGVFIGCAENQYAQVNSPRYNSLNPLFSRLVSSWGRISFVTACTSSTLWYTRGTK